MRISIRVYYEDTDSGGVVYYANYLKYFERGRTELLRGLGVPVAGLLSGGVGFVVRRAEVEYLRPARYDDLLTLETRLAGATGATITFEHTLFRDGEDTPLARGSVRLAAVGKSGKPVRVPAEVRALVVDGG